MPSGPLKRGLTPEAVDIHNQKKREILEICQTLRAYIKNLPFMNEDTQSLDQYTAVVKEYLTTTLTSLSEKNKKNLLDAMNGLPLQAQKNGQLWGYGADFQKACIDSISPPSQPPPSR